MNNHVSKVVIYCVLATLSLTEIGQMDPRRTSPRMKHLPKVVPDTNNTEMKKASRSRKRSKLTNNNAGRW
jgi:hypothetical protein